MQKISHEQALSFIDSFLVDVNEEKTAEESPITVNTSDTGGEAAGTVPASVEGSQDNSPDKTKEEEGKPGMGEFGKEKSQDMDGAIPTIGVEDAAAENNEKVDNERAAGDFNQEAIEGEKEEKPSYIEAEKMKVAEEINMKNELERAHNLSNLILNKIASQVEGSEQAVAPAPIAPEQAPAPVAQGVDKTAEEQKLAAEVEQFMKEAADEAYHDFVTSYQAGLLKRAQDEAAVQEALGIAPEEASGLLDEVAAEDPEAVMPAEEGMPEEAMMAEEGMPEEAMGGEGDIDEDALLEALVEAGVTPEELEAAMSEVDAEDGAMAGGMEGAEVPMEIEAAERKSIIKDLVRSMK